jgi:amino acid adenylation domain-containing protein
MMRHFQQLLYGIVIHPAQPISEIPILSDEERRQILLDWNRTKRDYGANETVLELLGQQAKETPENPAVIFEGSLLSYRELHAAANQVAHLLKKLGVGPEIRVGVCMERSAQLVIALLGILKAGGAYVPMDQSYPPARLNYMLEDAQVTVLLVDKNFTQKLKNIKMHASLVCLEEQSDTIGCESTDALEPGVTGDNLAYLIYTSGSTGQPKGVMSAHHGLLNRLRWMQEAYGLDGTDRVLQKTPFGFDVSVWEFFWPLMYGAVLVVARAEGHKDSRYLVETIQQEKITTIHFVPSMLQVFLQEPGIERCRSLRRVISSGEALSAPLVQEFQKLLMAELHNLYGPTEASIDVSCWECPRPQKSRSVLIGRPIANTQLYVLDSHLQPVPAGISGELYLGGAGLARGYWGRAELTAEKFVPNPFSLEAGARLYRTGDLVRWRADGNLEYLGRLDMQVKLRGYRIELGEIEAVLRQHPEVSQALVALKDNGAGEKRLTAYVVSNQGTDEIREYLKSKLPEYMIPSIVFASKIPLTVNGKIDYNALPAALLDASSPNRPYVAPRSAIEEQIAHACCDLLRIQRIGIHDNFFDLGGHSLLAMRLLTWARETFQAQTVPLRGFFETPTVAGLAALTVKCEPRPGQTEKIAKFLQQLNAMSPEEVMALRNKTMAAETAQNAVSKT